MTLTDNLASTPVLDRADAWLCQQRRCWPDSADVWALRRDWSQEKPRLQQQLRSGAFRLGLLERVEKEDGSEIEIFAARHALLLKALALVLGPVLPISRHCTHVKGHGGAKAAVRSAAVRLRHLPLVIRTDVRDRLALTTVGSHSAAPSRRCWVHSSRASWMSASIRSIAGKIGCSAETLRNWVRRTPAAGAFSTTLIHFPELLVIGRDRLSS